MSRLPTLSENVREREQKRGRERSVRARARARAIERAREHKSERRESKSKRQTQRDETCCKPKSPATSDLQNVRGFRCPCMHTLGHTQTRTHFSHFFSVRVHCECASHVFVACERNFVVILKEEERKVERRRDGGLVGETGGKGDPERGVRRECVCERGGAHCRARSQERTRRYKSFHSEN